MFINIFTWTIHLDSVIFVINRCSEKDSQVNCTEAYSYIGFVFASY